MVDVLRCHLESLSLPDAAVTWLVDLWTAIQTLDDIVDGDAVSRDDLDRMIFGVLVGLPGNPYFAANAGMLLPVVANALVKWKAADTQERNGAADERSYMWRAGYYDVVLAAVLLCHGPDTALKHGHLVLQMYGEKFADYAKEFDHA